MQPLPIKAMGTGNLDTLWRESIRAESHKRCVRRKSVSSPVFTRLPDLARTILALHHMDALWYQLLSVPRSISHLEIKHDLPCPESTWNARSAEDWALRRLTADDTGTPMRYSDAIRQLLSADSGVAPPPRLEYQGTLNVIHFLLSSIREVSGWSAMTGRVSLERYEVNLRALRRESWA